MKKYLVVFEKAENNYAAFVPDLPGCVATGISRNETESNIIDAIRLHIQGLREDNISVPKGKAFAEFVEID